MANPGNLAVIFDVDGVLIDSYWPHFQSWQRIAGHWGIDYSESAFAVGFGRTSREIIAEDWGLSDLSPEVISRIDDEKEAAYREIVADDFPAMPGASDLIRQLYDSGIAVAVGSSGPPDNVALAIEQLEIAPYLSAKVTGRDVTHGKPDPQIFLLAAERLGTEPELCVVVEDAPAGVEAAHRAGMACVGFPSTGRTPQDVAAAELVISSLTELSPEAFHDLLDEASRG